MLFKIKCWFLLFIVHSGLRVNCSEDVKQTEFNLTISSSPQCEGGSLDVEAGGRFQVFVHHGNGFLYNTTRCRWLFLNQTQKPSDFRSIQIYETRSINTRTLVSEAVETTGEWIYECVFYTKYAVCNRFNGSVCEINGNPEQVDMGVRCTTKVHIGPKALTGQLLVNDKTFTPRNGTWEYKFYEGEGITCTSHIENGYYIEMNYFAKAGKRSTGLRQANSVSLYAKLSAANKGDILECIFYGEFQKTTINLTLTPKDTRGILTFKVNDLTLTRTMKDTTTFYYEYMFHLGEGFQLRLLKDRKMYGVEICNMSATNVAEKYMRQFSFNSDVIDLPNQVTESFLDCVVPHKKDSRRKFYIRLKFSLHNPEYSPCVSGLSMSRVLFQYSTQTSLKIEYEIGSETLFLNCSCDRWEFTRDEVNTTDKNETPRPFQLRPDLSQAGLNCYDPSTNAKTFVKLLRESLKDTKPSTGAPESPPGSPSESPPGSPSESAPGSPPGSPSESPPGSPSGSPPGSPSESPPGSPSGSPPGSPSESPSGSPSESAPGSAPGSPSGSPSGTPGPGNDGISGTNWVVWIVVLLLVFLLAVGLWIGLSNKKRLRKNVLSNMDYQNLPEHHEGPMATPAQWDQADNIYAEPNSINKLYAKPTPKNKRNKTEPAYAQPKDLIRNDQFKNEPTYASVQEIEPTYANQNINLKSEVAYAEVCNRLGDSKDSASYNKKEIKSLNPLKDIANAEMHINSYANDLNIKPTKTPECKEPQKTYVNLLEELKDNSHGYANADRRAVEPAYCEIIQSKK